jgi:hypothetical protein
MGCLFVIVLGVLSAVLLYFYGYADWLIISLCLLWLASLVVSLLRGHVGFGGHGNTDVQIVIAGFGIAVALALPGYTEQRGCDQAKGALAELAQAEGRYFAAHERYSADIAALGLTAGPGVALAVERADDKAFAATASHHACGKRGDGGPKTFTWDSSRGGPQ